MDTVTFKIIRYEYSELVEQFIITYEFTFVDKDTATEAFDKYYEKDSYNFDRWYGEDGWEIQYDDDTQALYSKNRGSVTSFITLVEVQNNFRD